MKRPVLPGRRLRTPPTEISFDNALVCEDLEVRYGAVTALRGVTLTVGARELTVVIGPNGAGKTTLLRTICGIERPSGGTVSLDGAPMRGATPEAMLERGVAMVPEGRHVFPHLSVTENLELGAFRFRRDRATIRLTIQDVFERFPVLAERREQAAGTLSGGEQQMLAIGRALMSRPRLLCLDEPSLGLAPKVVKDLFALLRALRDGGVTVLLVEQFAYLALRAADRAYLLESGAVVRGGAAADLLADPFVRESYLGVRGRGESEEPPT